MSRFTLLLCLSAMPVLAADSALQGLLKRVEDRYNRAQTLQLVFSEGYKGIGGSRKPEAGTLFLRKPGRMRWDYSSPSGKLVLADGKYIYVFTPENKEVQKTKIKESDDMRTPLAFLLGRLHFQKDFGKFESRPEGPDTWITAEPKSSDMPYTKVEFVVTPQFQIRRVQVTGQDRSVLDFRFDSEKMNPPLDGKLFQFQLPAGARLIEAVP